MSSRTPGIQEVLTSNFEYQMSSVYTAIPGIILTVRDSLEQMSVDVQPAINIRTQDGSQVTERPPILNVPLQLPISKRGGLTFPVNVGDPVMLLFSMRGLEIWKRSNGYPTTPADMRMFDKRDCVAFPGIYPMSESPNNPSRRTHSHNPNDVVLVHNIGSGNEVEIRLTESGDVHISPGGGGKIYLNGDTEIEGELRVSENTTIEGRADIVQGVGISGIEFITHRHSGVSSGPEVSGPPVPGSGSGGGN